ncbi:MAG: bifunctional pyr operon transcriptional regulator/uracil phosphoribosyltransferase PyrR [Thermotogae bacterium]|nr:bifunctional pyr operon transcriptional regulator/uracil phosphoribosyltransferase PyrR [Thermotogota bacterium]
MYVLMNASQMERTLKRMALQIWEEHEDLKRLILVGIKTRGVPLARRLQRFLREFSGYEVPIGEIDITFYRDDLSLVAEAPEVRGSDLPFPLDGRRVVLVDDVLYTGRTVRAALDQIFEFGRPKAVKLAVLVDRGWRELPIHADYVGKSITTTESQIVKVQFPETDDVEEDRVLVVER